MKTIVVAGTDLFTVAAQELGDATQWYRVADLNGILDPMLYGLWNLKIPERNTGASGGLPSQ